MKDEKEGPETGRRHFLTGAIAAGAATAMAPTIAAEPRTPPRTPSARPPSAKGMAAEMEPPAEMGRIGGTAGSDFMVDVIKSLDIKYLPSNCASSFRGIHESLIDYGGNKMPEFITCMHEESAIGMAHGYFKITGKPLLSLCHGTVGLQHATMAIYNAWCDRVPLIVMGGNDMDAAHRPPGVPTIHAALDINAIVREYTKWDDTPISLQHFAQSTVRAYRIAMTPPYGPVAISLDAGLQQEPIHDHAGEKLYIPKHVPTAPPQGDSGAVKEAARLLAQAQNPVIVVDRVARTPDGVKYLVELAELLQARVVDQNGRMNFPNTHHLSSGPAVIPNADVILGMELTDFWGVVNSFNDNGADGVGTTVGPKIKPGTKLISITAMDLFIKSNYQYFERFQSVDVPIAADAQATLPALIEAVRSAIAASAKAAIQKRGDAARKAHADAGVRNRQAAAVAWDASPVSTARLCMETYGAIKDLDWSLVNLPNGISNWPVRLWPMEKHYRHIGGSGGAGQGYGPQASVGAALANRDLGRFTVSFVGDGDLMYAPGVLWTAAKHKIPLLMIVHNNRGWHQELMHVQRTANFRNRVVNVGNDMSPVGTGIQNPDVAYEKLAESMGWWAKGPIKDPAQLAPALKEAVAAVKSGQPALLNVWTQPR